MPGSASWMRRRTSVKVSASQAPRDRIRSSIRREPAVSVGRSAPGLAFDGDLDVVADLRRLLPRDVPLAFGFGVFSGMIRPFSRGVSQVAPGVFPEPLKARSCWQHIVGTNSLK